MMRNLKSFLLILKTCLFIFGWSDTAHSQVDFWQRIPGLESVAIFVIAVNTQGDIFVSSDSSRLFRKIENEDIWSVFKFGVNKFNLGTIAFNSKGELFTILPSGFSYSQDRGENWIPMKVGISFGGIGNFTIDSSDNIFVGTYGNGIFRTQDYGETVVYLCCTDRFIWYLEAASNGSIFAATNCCINAGIWTGSIFRSTTNGNNWTKVYEDTVYLSTGSHVSVVRANQKGDVVAIASAGIIYSSDNGETWTKINRDNPDFFSKMIVIDSRGDVYLGTSENGVFHYSSREQKWNEINTGLTDLRITALAIDRNDFLFAGTDGGGLFRSAKRTTSVTEPAGATSIQFSLEQNYPNPFNASTTIRFSLPTSGFVTLKVYNISGAEVADLVAGYLSAGKQSVKWTASHLPSGIYLYRIRAGKYVQTRKLTVLK